VASSVAVSSSSISTSSAFTLPCPTRSTLTSPTVLIVIIPVHRF
jgi:hypothetical protein